MLRRDAAVLDPHDGHTLLLTQLAQDDPERHLARRARAGGCAAPDAPRGFAR